MNFIPGRLYRTVLPPWLVELASNLENGETKPIRHNTILLFLERKRNGSDIPVYWFLDPEGKRIKFQVHELDSFVDRYFEEVEL